MTDNEIKNELEKLLKNQENGYITALEYGGKRDIEHEKTLDLFANTLDLINRLQAENEDKQTVIKEQGKIINGLIECQGKAIIAAYEEFAELVKANKRKLFNYIYSSKGFDNQINNLLKEKVGEDNG